MFLSLSFDCRSIHCHHGTAYGDRERLISWRSEDDRDRAGNEGCQDSRGLEGLLCAHTDKIEQVPSRELLPHEQVRGAETRVREVPVRRVCWFLDAVNAVDIREERNCIRCSRRRRSRNLLEDTQMHTAIELIYNFIFFFRCLLATKTGIGSCPFEQGKGIENRCCAPLECSRPLQCRRSTASCSPGW